MPPPHEACAPVASATSIGSPLASAASNCRRCRRRCARTASAHAWWKQPTRNAKGSAAGPSASSPPQASSHRTQASCAASSTTSRGRRNAAARAIRASACAIARNRVSSPLMRALANTRQPAIAGRRSDVGPRPRHAAAGERVRVRRPAPRRPASRRVARGSTALRPTSRARPSLAHRPSPRLLASSHSLRNVGGEGWATPASATRDQLPCTVTGHPSCACAHDAAVARR